MDFAHKRAERLQDFVDLCYRVGFHLEPFQKRIASALLGPEREKVITLPRKNGKSRLIGAFAAWHLLRTPEAQAIVVANSKEQAEFFIFVDRTSLMTRSNYDLTGGFTSRCATMIASTEGARQYDAGEIDRLPFKQNPDQYPDLSPFVLRLITEQWIEYEAERLRRSLCPSAPSRLSTVYAFGDPETCVEVARQHGWDLGSVRRFKPVPDLPLRAARVNMEIVSLMRGIYRLASWQVEDSDHIWSHYWLGGENLQLETPGTEGFSMRRIWNSGVIWEWLIEGRLVSENKAPVFS
jgi:hypothetical protein